jgi:Family of unknown function (DUF6352)
LNDGFWPDCGFGELRRDDRGWLVPTDNWLRRWLARPELALVEESCRAEKALHRALHEMPSRAVAERELAALKDGDARDNYRLFLRLRDALRAAGTIEACYVGLFQAGTIDLPPLFIDLLAMAIVRNLLDDCDDAFVLRAGEMLFRPQRISTQDGQLLAGDQHTLDLLAQTGGYGELGRLLVQAQAVLPTAQMQVLAEDNAAGYWQAGDRFMHLLDLRHEVTQDLGHGLQFKLARTRSGLKALARVLERWVQHLLGVAVRIQPEPKIDDAQWRWHLGLDATSSALLNDLYEGREPPPERLRRLISLFRLDFDDPAEMRVDVAGKPVYLGLAMNEVGLLRIKPQNLLLNLPLATPC